MNRVTHAIMLTSEFERLPRLDKRRYLESGNLVMRKKGNDKHLLRI